MHTAAILFLAKFIAKIGQTSRCCHASYIEHVHIYACAPRTRYPAHIPHPDAPLCAHALIVLTKPGVHGLFQHSFRSGPIDHYNCVNIVR